LDHSQNYKIFNARTIVLAFEITITVYNSLFFDPPCIYY